MDLIFCVWGLLTLVAEGVRCQGVYGECGRPNVIVTLCRRWPLVICSESQSSNCARAPRTVRKHQLACRVRTSCLWEPRWFQHRPDYADLWIAILRRVTTRLRHFDSLIMMKANVCLDVTSVPFNIHSHALLSCATANHLLISIYLNPPPPLSVSLPCTLCLHTFPSRATSGTDGALREPSFSRRPPIHVR